MGCLDVLTLGVICCTVFLLMVSVPGTHACPSKCRCIKDFYVYCDDQSITDQQLIEILQFVPSQARYLDLSKNQLYTLQDGVFSHLTDLRHLNLGGNQLRYVSNRSFSGLRNLEKLDLKHNHIPLLSSQMFAELHSLKYLYLESNNITLIENGTFCYLRKMIELNLCHNKIADVSPQTFVIQGSPLLRVLTLCDNFIKSLRDRSFSYLVHLRQLVLSYNQIESLGANVFAGLAVLEQLHLDHNKITRIMPSHFRQFQTTLTDLWLSSNQISTFVSEVFLGMMELENLYLDYNKISELQSNMFLGLNLKNLSLEGNLLSTIRQSAFSGMQSVNSLDLSYNEIYSIATGAFDSIRERIFVLNLEGNLLPSINSGTFRLMPYLQVLNVGNNSIEYIGYGSFADMESLQELNLSHNRLDVITSDVIRGANTLTKLFLHCNKLQEFKGFKFGNSPNSIHITINLTVLSLSESSVHVRWPYMDGSQNYWSLLVTCVQTDECPFNKQPIYLPPYKTDVVIEELSPFSLYYVCVNPQFSTKNIIIEQCVYVNTPERRVTTPPPDINVSSASTSDAWTLHNIGFSCTNFMIFMALVVLQYPYTSDR